MSPKQPSNRATCNHAWEICARFFCCLLCVSQRSRDERFGLARAGFGFNKSHPTKTIQKKKPTKKTKHYAALQESAYARHRLSRLCRGHHTARMSPDTDTVSTTCTLSRQPHESGYERDWLFTLSRISFYQVDIIPQLAECKQTMQVGIPHWRVLYSTVLLRRWAPREACCPHHIGRVTPTTLAVSSCFVVPTIRAVS